jgi:TonB family protein
VFRQFATEGLVPSVHRRGLERSVQAWLGVVSASEPPRTVAPSVLGLRSVSPSGPVSAAVLQEPAMQPTYPEVARRTGDSGTVVLTLRISEEGRVVTVDVERSSGFGALDNAARLTAFQWRFRAAQRDGVEVISFQRVMATFSTGAPGPRTTMRAVQG